MHADDCDLRTHLRAHDAGSRSDTRCSPESDELPAAEDLPCRANEALDVGEHRPLFGERSRPEQAGTGWSLRNLLPDGGSFAARHGLQLHAKFLKLVVIVLVLTLVTRAISCWLPGWSCKEDFSTADYFKYYWAEQCCDLLVVFFVGRMCGRRGSDTPLFLAMSLLGSLMPSAQETIPFLRVSFSTYAIMCQWRSMTFVWVAAEVTLLTWIAIKHVRHAIATNAAISWAAASFSKVLYITILFSKYTRALSFKNLCQAEAVALFVIFFLPNATDTALHVHHWYLAWIIALLARFDPHWSVATQVCPPNPPLGPQHCCIVGLSRPRQR